MALTKWSAFAGGAAATAPKRPSGRYVFAVRRSHDRLTRNVNPRPFFGSLLSLWSCGHDFYRCGPAVLGPSRIIRARVLTATGHGSPEWSGMKKTQYRVHHDIVRKACYLYAGGSRVLGRRASHSPSSPSSIPPVKVILFALTGGMASSMPQTAMPTACFAEMKRRAERVSRRARRLLFPWLMPGIPVVFRLPPEADP